MDLIEKVKNKSAKIGIIGLGYVELPLAIEFAKAGFHVTSFDIDPQKAKMLQEGKSYISYIPSERIKELVKNIVLPRQPISRN